MKILLIRHGMTEGNRDRKYIGTTDEPLCEEGRKQLAVLREIWSEHAAKLVFVSPMLRCRQTAEILFPGSSVISVSDLREMDFGVFEGRAWERDLEFDPRYLGWLDTNCEGLIPGGECKQAFTRRCVAGFYQAMEIAKAVLTHKRQDLKNSAAAFVVHGGTVMSVLSVLGEGSGEYYSFHTENGHGYTGEWDGKQITGLQKI